MKKRIDRRYIFLLVFAFFFSATLFFLKTHNDKKIFATKIFDPGNIISDEIMSDYNSLTKEEIQVFLKSKNHCRNTNIKIADLYPTVKYHIKDGHFVCMAEEDFNGESGAKIIKDAATDYKINPKVLIVLLEKEQSLITDTFPHNLQYRSATGYGCPDTAPCDQKYYGFKNQVRKAAALFRSVLDGGWTNYPLGINYIQYHPNISCGGSNVNIKNRATSALYRYTPYQPNQNIVNGKIDGKCGAYGNYNFFKLFQNWFKESPKIPEQNLNTNKLESSYLPDGNYSILTPNQDKAIDVAGADTKNGANIQLWRTNHTKAQEFSIKKEKNGFYTIKNIISSKAIDVSGGSKNPKANIQLWNSNQTCAQQWSITKVGEYYIIRSACSGNAIDIDGEENANIGANIFTEEYQDGKKSQYWVIKSL